VGAFILGAGIAAVAFDLVRPKMKQAYAKRNPWGAGTLEWVQEMPGKPWGIRSIPEIDSRYPLWDQPNIQRDIDQGRFYLPDAQEGLRETIVTSVIDARPEQCQRLPGPSFIPLVAALTLGGFFIFGTFHLWPLALGSLAAALAVICHWLWTGTAHQPEKAEKDVGMGLTLPIYVSGASSVGWWAMFITMLAVVTAYVCLVFGYFFFWTVHEQFPPKEMPGPGLLWPALGAGACGLAWILTLLARRWNKAGKTLLFYSALGATVPLSAASAGAFLYGPWQSGLDPTLHSYPAIVWLLVIWTALHLLLGVVMHLYCIARRCAGRMTARHEIDMGNATLFFHFVALTALITALVIAGFPLVAR
jgi:cytochrome c oxidase subunit I+III